MNHFVKKPRLENEPCITSNEPLSLPSMHDASTVKVSGLFNEIRGEFESTTNSDSTSGARYTEIHIFSSVYGIFTLCLRSMMFPYAQNLAYTNLIFKLAQQGQNNLMMFKKLLNWDFIKY